MMAPNDSLYQDISEIENTSVGSDNKESVLKKKCCNSALCTQVFVSLVVSLMELLAGVILGYTGIILPTVTNPDTQDIYLNPQQVSYFTSTLMIGTILGTFITVPFIVRYGLRIVMLLFMPLGLSGWLICYFANTFWLLLLSRILLGIFSLVCFACTAPFIAETVHCSLRGRLMAFCDIAKQVGLLFVYLVGSSDLDWRTVGLVCGLTPLVIPCIVLVFVPNSPRWTAVKGRSKEEVIESLRYFRDRNYDIDMEYNVIKEDVLGQESVTTFQQLKILKERSILKRLLFLVYLCFAFILSGSTVLLTYCASIFQLTDLNVYTSTNLIGAVSLFSTLFYLCIADRFGRRPIFLVFCSFATLSMGALGLFFYLKHIGYDTSPIYWLPLASLTCFNAFTGIYQPVVVLLSNELLPNSVRNLGINILILVFNLGSFLTVWSYPMITESIGSHWAFWVYAINSLVLLVVMYFFMPETKGKSLEETANLF